MKKIILFSFLLALLSQSCKKTATDPAPETLDINDPDKLTEVLDIPNSNLVSGNAPTTTNTGSEPGMITYDSTIAYSVGSQIRFPIEYEDNSGAGISGIYLQVNGATSYIDVSVSQSSVAGTLVLPIGIPDNLGTGQFTFVVCIYDGNGNISVTTEVTTTITEKFPCNTDRESGGEGLTSTTHTMGGSAGWVKIEYETFTLPDRIDVFYDGDWVGGTGTDPGLAGSVPPLADCDNPTNGYIGANSTLFFPYNPATSEEVEVVVSGCTRSTTAWNYSITCFVAEPSGNCDGATFTDTRNGQTYPIVEIGNQCWFAKNLNFETGNSWCYDDDPANCDISGRLYDWQTAKAACPNGWHLPSVEELNSLLEFLDSSYNPIDEGSYVAGGKMKSTVGWLAPNVGATNSSGFSALPGGYRQEYSPFDYLYIEDIAFWWTSSEILTGIDTGPIYYAVEQGDTWVVVSESDIGVGYSCRCIKD